jgi:quercetin dioxygenase-like cupin family protein
LRIHTFAADHARRIEVSGSDFLQVPLSQPGDVCMASAMFLRPGGVIGRHETTTPQLLCVIAGSGFVSGSDGVEVPIGQFEAAFWEAGENHETRTDTGMTTITLEGTSLQPVAPTRGS